MSESFPKRLSTNAFLLFEQAERVEPWNIGNHDQDRVLVFARRVVIEGRKVWQIAAYKCDKHNSVYSWRERYDIIGPKFRPAMFNLAYRICNNLIEPKLIENLRNV